MKKESACVLASGGLDSAALLSWALRRHRAVFPVFVRFGLRWERAELAALRRIWRALARPGLKPLTVLLLPAGDLYGRHWSLSGPGVPSYRSPDRAVYLPGRNLLLLAKAGVFCARKNISVLYLGTLAGNPFPDSGKYFLRSLSRSISLALGRPITARAPFRRWSKDDVLRRCPSAPYALAFSCLRPKGLRPCGACNKCAERDRVLRRWKT